MSMHKLPLSELEEEGLRVHGLSIGTPSQLSDAFRQGIAWALSQQDDNEATSPAQGEQQPPYPHEVMDVIATSRYQVVASGSGPLSRYSVRAGDGEQELYRGGKSDCEHVARKLVGSFLDGGLTAFGLYTAPIAQTSQQTQFNNKA